MKGVNYMFFHVFKYNFLSALREKGIMFWIAVFPIILGTLFNIAFSHILESENFDTVPVAIVEIKENQAFSSVLDSVSKGDNPLLKPDFVDEKNAKELLSDNKCKGIIYVGDEISLTVSSSGASQSVLKGFLDQYIENEAIIKDIAASNPSALENVIKRMSEEINCNTDIQMNGNTDVTTQYFYNLIAMVCLFGSFLGMNTIIKNQGNLSEIGARKCVSPVRKSVSLLAGLLSSYILHVICVFISLAYIVFVLGVDLTDNLAEIVLIVFAGSLAGITMGFFVGSIGKLSANAKQAVLTSFSMLLCFFSGLMMSNMRMVVEKKFPLLNRISPAALISDSFYSINIYGAGERFYTNIITLLIVSVIFAVCGLLFARRDSYVSL